MGCPQSKDNMNIRLKVLILLLSIPSVFFGQNNPPVFELNFGAKELYFDDLSNVYSVDSTYRLKKYRSNGQQFAEYNNTLYGIPGSFDFTNPFQPLVFYPGIGRIVSLDANLSVVETFFLRDLNLIDVGCIVRSKDNHFWVYDNIDAKIKKIDVTGRVLTESLLVNMYWDEDIQITKLQDVGKYIVALVQGRGLLIFDLFGTMSNKLILEGISNFFISGNHILIQYDNCSFTAYTIQNNIEKPLDLKLEVGLNRSCLAISSKNIGIVEYNKTYIYSFLTKF